MSPSAPEAWRERALELERRLDQMQGRLDQARARVNDAEAETARLKGLLRSQLSREEQLRAAALAAAAATCPRDAVPEELLRRTQVLLEYVVHGPKRPATPGGTIRQLAQQARSEG